MTDELLKNKLYRKKEVKNLVEFCDEEEKRFYQHRIVDLCKRILINKIDDENIPQDIVLTFHGFMKQCISYFNAKDKSDILQSELNEFSIIHSDFEATKVDQNDLLPHFFPSKPITYFDKHAVRKNVQKVSRITLPLEREYNLKDPPLSLKGLLPEKTYSDSNINDENQKEIPSRAENVSIENTKI
jgi:hypothetical protein